MAQPTKTARPLDLRELLEIVRRRAVLILAIWGVCIALAASVAVITPVRYTATAEVQLHPGRESAAEQDRPDLPPDQARVDTEVGIIRSPEVAQTVAVRLGLDHAPPYSASASPALAAAHDLLDKVQVSRNGETYLVSISATDGSPGMAARTANSFAQAYLDYSRERRSRAAREQAATLAHQIDALGKEITAKEDGIARQRGQAGIVQGGSSGTVTDQQVAPLAGELASAQAEAASSQGAWSQTLRSGTKGVESPLLNDLRRQRADLIQRRSEQSTRLGPNNAEMRAFDRQIADLDAQIGQEAARAMNAIKEKAAASASALAQLKVRNEALQGQQVRENQAGVATQGLERDVEAKRRVYNQLAQQQQQLAQEGNTAEPVGTVSSEASAPTRPSRPNRPLILLLGAVAGGVLGFGALLGAEALDSRMRTGQEVERGLTLPLAGAVPMLSEKRRTTADGGVLEPWDYAYQKPMSVYSETLRAVRRTLHLEGEKKGAQVIAICSSVPNEGKTGFAASLARLMALSEDRVILLDGDLRRSSLRNLMGHGPEKGLAEVLTGEAALDAAIVRDTMTSLDLLPLSEATFRPDDVFRADRLTALFAELRKRYDFILVDTPPLLAVDDGRALARAADQVLLLVRWNSTPRRAARSSLRRLREDGAHVVGAVLTMFERKWGMPNPTQSAYYDKAYSNYYQE